MLAPAQIVVDRRTFLTELGRGAVALAILGVAGCSPSTLATFAPTPGGTAGGPSPSPAEPTGTGGPGSTPAGSPPAGSPAGAGVSWNRVNLGFVSAYLLVRGGEAVVVDTGVAGSGAAILKGLQDVGLGWNAVAHVVLTHHHNDHQGSLSEILQAAPAAAAYAGAEDIPSITSPRALTAVGDGDDVFGLRIVTTPGHTAGSISVYDPGAGIVVVGDALRTDGGRPTLPGAQFTIDMDEAKQSIVKLGGLTFETLLPGHGDPIESGAAALVAQLGAS
jgi:glyoxylase-like metal-dependent hydrolase (beta-lactamase superfamily II)